MICARPFKRMRMTPKAEEPGDESAGGCGDDLYEEADDAPAAQAATADGLCESSLLAPRASRTHARLTPR
jgi:hypothetical protein